MTLMASLSYFEITVVSTQATLVIVPGQVVDFDAELKPGFTIAMAIAGREADFVTSP
jgi:hypothetical protein